MGLEEVERQVQLVFAQNVDREHSSVSDVVMIGGSGLDSHGNQWGRKGRLGDLVDGGRANFLARFGLGRQDNHTVGDHTQRCLLRILVHVHSPGDDLAPRQGRGYCQANYRPPHRGRQDAVDSVTARRFAIWTVVGALPRRHRWWDAGPEGRSHNLRRVDSPLLSLMGV